LKFQEKQELLESLEHASRGQEPGLSLLDKKMIYAAMGFTNNNRTTGMGNHW
jgi:hypothetical protein